MKFLLQLDDLFAAERDPRPLQIRVRHQGSLPMAFGPEVLLFVQLPVRFPGTGDGVRWSVGSAVAKAHMALMVFVIAERLAQGLEWLESTPQVLLCTMRSQHSERLA